MTAGHLDGGLSKLRGVVSIKYTPRVEDIEKNVRYFSRDFLTSYLLKL